MRTYRSFADFWPFCLREHARPRTRAMHYAVTSLLVLIAAAALLSANWWLLLAIAGCTFAWATHALIERDRPATLTYPLWSLAADFRMWWFWLTGRLSPELPAAGVPRQAEAERDGH